MTKNDILRLIKSDSWMMDVLQKVDELKFPDWWIGAGFVRSKVWDSLHHYKSATSLPDIDVIYFNDANTSEASEKKYEQLLRAKDPSIKWSVKNQARMHMRHNDKPYKNATEGLSRWVETATCVGVKLEKNKLVLTAPHGVYDLTHLILRPTHNTPEGRKKFLKRIEEKHWLTKWPKLKIAKAA